MSFLSSSCSFSRYRVINEIPDHLWSQIQDLLVEYSFQEIEDTNEEQAYGWVCFENMLDNIWKTAPPQKAEYLAFSLRLDTRRIPAAVFKKHYQIGLEKLKQNNKEKGKNFVSREQKAELREQLKMKLLSRTLPIPALFEVIWNPQQNRIYFDSIQPKVKNLFEDLFSQTFQLYLEPLSPYFLAFEQLNNELQEKLNRYEPMTLV